MAHQSRIACGDYCGCHHCADERFNLPCVVHDSSPFRGFTRRYCSSSPASVNALLAVDTDAPQTTLVAEVVPVLAPQTTLNALSVLSFQGTEAPHTTDVPFTTEAPQTTEVPQTTELPQTTEVEDRVELPSTRVIVWVRGL